MFLLYLRSFVMAKLSISLNESLRPYPNVIRPIGITRLIDWMEKKGYSARVKKKLMIRSSIFIKSGRYYGGK